VPQVAEAFAWGAFGGAALIVGALAGVWLHLGTRLVGLVMALGSGVLISAVSFDLVEEAAGTADRDVSVALGLAAGALTFFVGDRWIDRLGGGDRKDIDAEAQAEGSGLGIALGAVLDGIPESIVLGLTLLGGGGISLAFVAAVFISNLPEGLASSAGMHASGWPTTRIVALWTAVTVVSGTAALAGYALFDTAAPGTVAFVLAFAGGAVLTMLADTMMPEAFEHAGPLVGLVTTAGFALAFGLHLME
jgi:zinc transporter, ZIP family